MATSPADRRRWDGPFDKGSAMNFLVRMPVGATAQLCRPDGDLIGWLLQRGRDDLFFSQKRDLEHH